MTGRHGSLVFVAAMLLGIAALYFLWPRDGRPGAASSSLARPVPAAVPVAGPPPALPEPRVMAASGEANSRIAEKLNDPDGTARRDLEIVSELFVAWQSNFPGQGNPVGENAEITAALTGDNRFKFAFIPPGHRAINRQGELCDRWGTPFRFHQASGTLMEIRSAGPDRKFATADDVAWPP